ncbi:MAG: hypothetical protein WB715_12615 [Roseiarcus sp.]|uniref:hypothetical protein n=1 Tax=Roseiarcus sp. TaxID=1969460 RepID=UPI003C377688
MLPRLLKLKQWLTVPDASRHLSNIFDDEVSEADVLRLALDRQLTLSINLLSHVAAHYGPVLSQEVTAEIFDKYHSTLDVLFRNDIRIDEIWHSEKDVIDIDGVWDLTMLGRERDDIERRYQSVTSGNDLQKTTEEGPYLSKDRTMCKLLGNFDYVPSSGLPSDGVLVVRTSALRELEMRVSELDKQPEKSFGQRERTTLLVIVAALAKLARVEVNKPSAAAATIERQTELMGTRVAARTIENHLNRISEALESRQEH